MDRVIWTQFEQFTFEDGNRLNDFPQTYFKELMKAFSGDKEDWLGGLGPGFDPTATGLSGTDLSVDIPAQYFGAGGLVSRQPDETILLLDGGAQKKYWLYFVITEQDVTESRTVVNPVNATIAPANLVVRKIEARALEIVVLDPLDPEAAPNIGDPLSSDPTRIIIGVTLYRSYTYTPSVFPPDSGPDDPGPVAVTPGFATLTGHAASHVDESGGPTADRIAFPTNVARGMMPARSLPYLQNSLIDVVSANAALTAALSGSNTGAVNPGDLSNFEIYPTAPKTVTINLVLDPDWITVGGSGLTLVIAPNLDAPNGVVPPNQIKSEVITLVNSLIPPPVSSAPPPNPIDSTNYFTDFIPLDNGSGKPEGTRVFGTGDGATYTYNNYPNNPDVVGPFPNVNSDWMHDDFKGVFRISVVGNNRNAGHIRFATKVRATSGNVVAARMCHADFISGSFVAQEIVFGLMQSMNGNTTAPMVTGDHHAIFRIVNGTVESAIKNFAGPDNIIGSTSVTAGVLNDYRIEFNGTFVDFFLNGSLFASHSAAGFAGIPMFCSFSAHQKGSSNVGRGCIDYMMDAGPAQVNTRDMTDVITALSTL